MDDQPRSWLLYVLLLLPLSHYDVPQQGLLGELILIQQQIQRHEEEVRRAAAANSARPSPPGPAPNPPQQKPKVKVPCHLGLPCSSAAPKRLALQSRNRIHIIYTSSLDKTLGKLNTRLKNSVSLPSLVLQVCCTSDHTQHHRLGGG